ncbi:glycosyl transferase [Roseateles violae]|uniref:Glycosyl transferase n=1 Tax=Roseateles violae TaxID=3058042 RepID=A0ABT8DRV8_9BURK|nr:glycosyl transferase [Pelomonas sp. PFR6]MDN3919034.1 glycosyl transferase [Pelomonas sp. PFR6]
MKQIICVKWGQKFGPDYVNRLYGMVRRNISGPFRLVCLTDDARGLRREVEAYALPELGCAAPQRSMGKWRKLVLWGAELPALTGLSGPVLFIDLDSVIVDNIDGYFSYGDPEDVILARNWAKPLQRLGQTSVFRFPAGRHPQILAHFRANPQGIADRCRFEQHYITEAVPGGIKFWPEAWTRHFRLHCLPPFPLRYFMPARLPQGAKIVTFPGGPNPSDVQLGRWSEEQPAHPGRLAHLRAGFGPGRHEAKLWRHLTRFVMPVGWIGEHWIE